MTGIMYMAHAFTWLGDEQFDGLVQERRNSSAIAVELCLACTNPTNCTNMLQGYFTGTGANI